jgi:hypothetical protein
MVPRKRVTPGVVLAALALSLAPSIAFGQAKKPVTIDDLIQLTKAGLDEQTLVRAIEANGAAVDTSAQGILALKSAGLGEAVIRAVLTAAAPSAAPPSATPPAAVAPGATAIPDEIGVYIERGGSLEALTGEVPNVRSGGILKSMATAGIAKMNVRGTVSGGKSSIQVQAPVILVLRCQEGTTPAEYQILILDSKKDRREFTTGKAGVTGMTVGVDNDKTVSAKFDRIGPRTYKATISQLARGEYGVWAPGVSALGPKGKIYTFGVVN